MKNMSFNLLIIPLFFTIQTHCSHTARLAAYSGVAAYTAALTYHYVKYPDLRIATDQTHTAIANQIETVTRPGAESLHATFYTGKECPLAKKGNACAAHHITRLDALARQAQETLEQAKKDALK